MQKHITLLKTTNSILFCFFLFFSLARTHAFLLYLLYCLTYTILFILFYYVYFTLFCLLYFILFCLTYTILFYLVYYVYVILFVNLIISTGVYARKKGKGKPSPKENLPQNTLFCQDPLFFYQRRSYAGFRRP